MNRLLASTLALALAASGTASAQTYGGTYLQPTPDQRGRDSGAQYDYARVLRVDPVFDSRSGYGNGNSGYGNNSYASGYGSDAYSRNCYERNTTVSGYERYPDGRYGNDGYRDDRYNDPYGGRRSGSQVGGTVATVVGGLVGAVLGSQVGGGTGRYATSAIGSMVGGMAGRHIYEEGLRQRDRTGTVRVCDPVPVDRYSDNRYGSQPVRDSGVTAYDVTYEYAGRRYATRTNYHPGDRIRVRVDVRPE
ncbi:MAG: glycine zipper 2TM domain-containing protein [Lysobacter sp.]|nr:glycine zipper 2TM domain-containing protein [Lysobacter sp.]MDQ3269363.1 glycine zipper 2TM domain-containing protein [Pseudomonadota bacterium]